MATMHYRVAELLEELEGCDALATITNAWRGADIFRPQHSALGFGRLSTEDGAITFHRFNNHGVQLWSVYADSSTPTNILRSLLDRLIESLWSNA